MSNWAERAFGPAEARYKAAVMQDTWGLLAPRRNARYKGHVVWALGCFGNDNLNPSVIECRLTSKKAGELDGSPWFYDALIDFLHAQSTEYETVWRFDGYFCNYEFVGSVRQLDLSRA